MAGPFQRRIGIALAAGAVSLAVWAWVPGTSLDRAAFSTVCRAFANPPFFVNGGGSHAAPWKLRGFTGNEHVDPEKAPVVISLGDDPNNIFQSSPQSPLDLAVILSNFQRHGVKRPAIAAVLAWDKPDVMSLSSLEVKLGAFESITMTAPLARGAVPETMPAAFRRASIPLGRVSGDTSALPVVNRLPVSGVILGGENCAAGFQSIDSEKGGKSPALLARWEDRVVFAFPLVAAMRHLSVSPDDLEVRLGEWLKLGKDGPTLPIDRYGRLTMPLSRAEPRATIKAEDLIDAAPGLIPDTDKTLVLLRDDHSAGDPTTASFSRKLASMLTAITSDAGLKESIAFHRPQARTEAIFLAITALVLAWISGRSRFQQSVGFLTVAGVLLIIQWIGVGTAQLWLPGIAALCGTLAAGFLSRLLPEAVPVTRVPKPVSAVKEAPPRMAEPATTPAAEIPAVTEAPVETPAKKAAKKRVPAAKKTARKSAPKSNGAKGKKPRN